MGGRHTGYIAVLGLCDITELYSIEHTFLASYLSRVLVTLLSSINDLAHV